MRGPAFASAGGHWNPTARKHGRDNPAGAHLGDLPDLVIDADSAAAPRPFTLPHRAPRTSTGPRSSFTRRPMTIGPTPSGNSGDRIACAVLTPPR